MSKKNVSALVSALGVLMGFITALVSAVRKKGGTDEELYKAMVGPKSELLIEELADRIIWISRRATKFPVWKTITIGYDSRHYRFHCEYYSWIQSSEFQTTNESNWLLKKIPILEFRAQIDLVKLSVADLGFKDGATYEQIIRAADEIGLNLCPAEVAPALRLIYSHQPSGEHLYVAMGHIKEEEDNCWLFTLYHDAEIEMLSGSSMFLGATYFNSEEIISSPSLFIFVYPHVTHIV